MAFESLTARLGEAFRRLRGRGRLTEADVDQALREIRLALLEADVSVKVVRPLIGRIREKAVGAEILKSLNPAQQVVKIVYDELVDLLGGTLAELNLSRRPAVILMVGLQGAGKTTTAGKLARHLAGRGKKPLLVAADVTRPAAVTQLEVLGRSIDVPVHLPGDLTDPVAIAEAGLSRARAEERDVVIVDTAGRLHIDEVLMAELKAVKAAVRPDEILLVVDAMTGQEAVAVAERFHDALTLTGVILTKLDGDTRGGAALSVKAATGVPIKFAATGERLDALEPFYPDRMASRILGMGDVLTLIEKAQAEVDEQKARELERKLRRAEWTLTDFLDQLRQLKKMGPLEELLKMIPGVGARLGQIQVDEKQLARLEAIILSMTPEERERPEIINYSRRKRIAAGSGTTVADVNRLLKQFEEARKLMKQMAKMGGKKGKGPRGFKFPFPFP
ncbi:signal recognition particle protein [Hydrogenibacillus sp. N12]|uniref:signal recognition particle protein n=1 Tax=Hydrogenibacillus sp. N12 TaxID=2866627 RepID=UPI001C7DD954|nr:signal recognition particle protein [Hydrogenibacillus sp. N12]QZA33473.1 signal recognition particle protein [Hydrogenibacillus sp. N12]